MKRALLALNLVTYILLAATTLHGEPWTITSFCIGRCCCGPRARGITKSGARAIAGVTAACAPELLGAVLQIEGLGLRWCEDTGSGVRWRHVDILLPSHAAAVRFGLQRAAVRVLYSPPRRPCAAGRCRTQRTSGRTVAQPPRPSVRAARARPATAAEFRADRHNLASSR